jgi:O-antigen/teichoic acid export membrane protein
VVVKMSGSEHGKGKSFGHTNSFLLLISLAIVVGLSIPLWLLAEPISVALFDQSRPDWVQLGLLLLVMTNASGLVASLLVTGRETRFLPVASIVAAPVGVVLAWVYVPEAPVIAAVVAMIFLHSVEFIIKLGVAIWKKIVSLEGLRTPPQGLLAVFTSSLAILILSSAVNAIAFWLLRFLLVGTADAFTPLAQFDVAFQYLAVEMMVINNAVTIFQSRSAKASDLDPDEARRIHRTGIQLTALIAAAACIGNLVFAELMIGIYGEGYDPQLLRALTAVVPVYAAAVFFNRYFVNEGKPGILLLVSILSSAVALAYAVFIMQTAYDLTWAFVIYFAVSNLIYLGFIVAKRQNPGKAA